MRYGVIALCITALLAFYRFFIPDYKVITVLDDATHRPIPDAWVSVARIQYTPTSNMCVEVLSEKADADGKASFFPKRAYEFDYYAYMPGYSIASVIGNTIYLKPATTNPGERLRELYRLSLHTTCGEQGIIAGNFHMHEAIAAEAVPLATRLMQFDLTLPLEPQIEQADSACGEVKRICQNLGNVAFVLSDSKYSIDWVEKNSPECFVMLTCPRQQAGKNCAVHPGCGEFCWSGAYVTRCNQYGDRCSERFEPLGDNQGYHYPHAPKCPTTSMGFAVGKDLGKPPHR